MAFCRSLISIVLCVVSVSLAVDVPVFLWGDVGQNSMKHSALSSVPAQEFRKALKHELIEDPFLVVFIEETLSVEDFSRKVSEDASLPYLESEIDDAVYFPSVQDPLKVLNKLANSGRANHVKLTASGLSADVSSDEGNYLFINLKDAKEGESREELLRRHDSFMEDMFAKLQNKYDKVVGVYTAHYPSWTVVSHSRVRREATETKPKPTSTPNVTSLAFAGLKIYFQNVFVSNGTGNGTLLSGAAGDPTSFVNETKMHSTLTFAADPDLGEVKATLNFESARGYWYLSSATLSVPSKSIEAIVFPTDDANQLFGYSSFSYRCATNITLATISQVNSTDSTGTWKLIFHNSRMQPFFNGTNSSALQFGDMLNCVGFFSAPIWAGLMVTFIMLAITFYGIMMMMDIRTMDRFDDPKGKTITINATE